MLERGRHENVVAIESDTVPEKSGTDARSSGPDPLAASTRRRRFAHKPRFRARHRVGVEAGYMQPCLTPGAARFIAVHRDGTTHNREVSGSNPPEAMPVPEQNAVCGARRKVLRCDPLNALQRGDGGPEDRQPCRKPKPQLRCIVTRLAGNAAESSGEPPCPQVRTRWRTSGRRLCRRRAPASGPRARRRHRGERRQGRPGGSTRERRMLSGPQARLHPVVAVPPLPASQASAAVAGDVFGRHLH